MAAVITGAGDEVVLVHGALGDYRQWTAIGERLCGRHTVVAISRRYHWPNSGPPAGADYTYDSHCRDLLQYLDTRDRAVHLVGHSWGAGVVLLAALRARGRIRTLTLIEPAFNSLLPQEAPGLSAEQASRAAMLQMVRTLVDRGRDEDAARELIDWIQGGAGGFAGLPPAAQRVLLANAATIGPTFAHVPPDITGADLRTIGTPALVLRGARTRAYYRLIADALPTVMPEARTVQIPGAGHMSIVEKPDDTADLLLEFLGTR